MTLTLCLIARDEEAMLPGCLASVAGVVDEIVVCDTGSTDGTVAVAEAAGAKVVFHAWNDDFAAARNAALEAATGDFVLVLDADERLAPGAGEALRGALEGAPDCGMLPLHNASSITARAEDVVSGAARLGEPVSLPRLLRRTGGLRWEGRIHESVAAWIQEGGRRVGPVAADIVHLGNVPELRAELGKDDRNRKLLERAVQEGPDDSVLRTYYARELVRAGDAAGGAREAAEAFSALERAWARGEKPAAVATAALHGYMLLQRGDYAGCEAAVGAAVGRGAEHPNLLQLLGVAHERQAAVGERDFRLAAARVAFSRCLELHGRSFPEELSPGVTSWGSGTWLGIVELQLGEAASALERFTKVLQQRADEAARLGRVEALLELGETQAALAELEALLGERPDGWVLAASAMESIGRYDELPLLLGRARAFAERGFVSPHRRVMHAELAFRAELYAGRVVSAPGRWASVSALLGRSVQEGDEAPSADELRGLAFHLVRAGQVALLEPVFERRAEEVVPGFRAVVESLMQELGLPLEHDGEPDFVFVGGAGRSGTTLFRAMLDAHESFHCGPEAKLVPAICALREQWVQTMGGDLAAAGVDDEVLDGAVRGFVSGLMSGLGGGAARVAEKTPHNMLHIGLLGRLFPRARFVHLVRDGRAVAASLVKQRWIEPGSGKPIWYCADLDGGMRYWSSVVQAARAQAVAVPGRYLEVRYEDLVARPEETMRRVMAFLGERWDPAVLEHHRGGAVLPARESSSEAVAEAVHTRAVERWRGEIPRRKLSELEALHGALLGALGYAVGSGDSGIEGAVAK